MVSKQYQFPEITEEMHDKLAEWYATHNDGKCANSYHGAVGGNVIFEICPTSIGDFVGAKCSCGEKYDLGLVD